MIRKMLVIAAAVAMPIGAVAVIGVTGGVAGAKKVPVPPDPAATCSVSATVNFAPPGLSKAGSTTTAKDTFTTTTPGTFGAPCTSGSGFGAQSITSKAVKCNKKVPGQTNPETGPPSENPACEPGLNGYDSWGDFESGGTSTIQKALKHLDYTLNGIAYETKTTGSSEVVGGACGSDVGFEINGVVSKPKQDKGQTSTLIACLGAITGTGLNPGDNFFDAAVDQQGTVATAAIDPSVSTVSVSGP